MERIQWARGSQFNWVFDNLGGTPLQEAAAGNASGAAALVREDGTVRIEFPNPGGGRVHYIRGVWRRDTQFAWDGFWAAAIDGDATNYFAGGSFANAGETTTIALGTPLPPGVEVQLFYIYFTGEEAARYEALNNHPCIRRASRGREDYTYDFAVDRLLDLMVYLYLAEKERGRDYEAARNFLWQAFESGQHSLTPPLVYDSFERQLWERGAFLLYRNSTLGDEAFQVFQTELAEGYRERVLRVRAELPSMYDGAWFGYGLDWSLTESPFREMDRVFLKLKGRAAGRRLHNLTKYGSGSAQLMFAGDYQHQGKRRFVVMMEISGEVGEATFKWSQDGGLTWEEEGLVSGDRDHAIPLMGGFEVYWQGGSGADFAAGDYWTFWGGEPVEHPRRLLVCLNDSAPGDADPWGPAHTFVHALPDRFSELTVFEIPFSQFWRRDNIIDDGDRVRATWGAWHAASQPDDSRLTISDREETETLFGDVFYTQRRIAWDLSPYATAFGAWVGIDTGRCSSSGRADLNFLLKPEIAGLGQITVRVKVKDAQGSYFYADRQVQVDAWQRVSVSLAGMALESGSLPLTHPIQLVDIGIAASPPSNGAFYVTDLKFDEPLTFAGAQRLRLLEFKIEQQGLLEHEWWLDEVGLNLIAEDAYPYAPRLAVSMGPYGQNPWRGPTLVHYAQPLAPHLAGARGITETYLKLHRDAQDEFSARYGGLKGPVMPVHTRNDLENIALCGEENFGRFCWWSRHRDYGKAAGVWHFNGCLTDASGKNHPLTWSEGEPAFTTGICQPGATALAFDGSGAHAAAGTGADFLLGGGDFTLEAVARFADLSGDMVLFGVWQPSTNQRSWVWRREGQSLALDYSTTGGDSFSKAGAPGLGADAYYHLVVTRAGDTLSFYINGNPAGVEIIGDAAFFAADAPLRFGRTEGTAYGYLNGALDYAAIHKGRAMSAAEVRERYDIIHGRLNGSDYPEAGYALGQFWAFYRLAQYFFVTGDAAAWEILEHWLAWIDAHGVADGSGWNFPLFFSEYGFVYSTSEEAGWFETDWFKDGWFEGASQGNATYDPGVAASIALGCLHVFLRNGNETAGVWARRILDDLRLNRQAAEFGGGYRSDYHYAWLNALVAQAFGLAAYGLAGQAYRFPAVAEDQAHFEALLAWMFNHAGDAKPNLLNAELIPFTYVEDADVWDYAPHYVFMSRMGSLEALVLMAGTALDYGKASGDWIWFERLVRFVLADRLSSLAASRIRSLATSQQLAAGKNVVRLFFADYDQDNSHYCEARDEEAVSCWGEQALDLDCRYGAPVILENPEVAGILAARLLKRLSTPWEEVQVETWLEGARLELGDILAVSSDFHNLAQEPFTVFGKTTALKERRVHFDLARPALWTWTWAVDAAGGGHEAYAIDRASRYDENWEYRAYAF
jgi:hypothetical protein